ncbi:MAG: right-handed parallel beta-helix repeat-containing protein [Candidatus Thorarchaeota archaeon]
MHLYGKTWVLIIFMLCILCTFPKVTSNLANVTIESFESTDSPSLAYVEHDPINITSDLDFSSQKNVEGWSGNGSASNPYFIEGYNITYRGYSITITNITSHFVIRNCYLASNLGMALSDPYDDGIQLINVANGEIVNNTILNNGDGGIYAELSNISVSNNTIIGNRLGVIFVNSSGKVSSNRIQDSSEYSLYFLDSIHCDIRSNRFLSAPISEWLIQNSAYITIEDNTFQATKIILRAWNTTVAYNNLSSGSAIGIQFCSNVIVEHNNIINPSLNAIEVGYSNQIRVTYNTILSDIPVFDNGIMAFDSDNCLYSGNIISTCLNGIDLAYANSSVVTYNYIVGQQNYGINIYEGSEYLIYGNLLTNEGIGPARDSSTDSQWDDGSHIGNFWEAISDTFVEIPGSAASVDRLGRSIGQTNLTLPLVYESPIINIIEEDRAEVRWIIWSNQGTYSLYRNGFELESRDWEGSGLIYFEIGNLPNGFYTYSILLQDSVNGIVSTLYSIEIPNLWFVDSDMDGMPDDWEIDNNLNPFFDDAGWDHDSDDLFNIDEYRIGTDPSNPDSDFDSIYDGWEVHFGLDPLNASDALMDLDSDSLTNLQEFEIGTDPTNPDSDLDNFPDAWEVKNGFDPTNPAVSFMQYFVASAAYIAIASSLVILLMSILYLGVFDKRSRMDAQVRKEEEDEQAALEELLE